MSRLFLRFPEPLDHAADQRMTARVEWLVLEDDNTVAAEGRAPLADLPDLAEQSWPWVADPAKVVVFIAATEALALSCQVPGRNAMQLRRAAPYAVEEFVTEDIEAMQVACGPLVRGEPVRCLVAPRAGVAGYLACLESAGIRPGWLTTDALALPTAPGMVTVLYIDNTALVRTVDQAASVDEANLPVVLDAMHADLDAAQGPRLRQINGTLSELHLSQLELAPEQLEQSAFEGTLLAYLASEFQAASAINLLQGDFAPKRAQSGPLTRWRAVAASVGVWLAVAVAAFAAEGIWATYQADALRDEANQLYRDIYDVERVPGNPATRMRSRLGQTPEAKVGFHHLLGHLGSSLQQLGGRYELVSVSYSERSGLGAEVMVADYDAVETLKDALAEREVELEVASAEQEQERVRTNLRMVEAG